MSRSDKDRITLPQTIKQLRKELAFIFAGSQPISTVPDLVCLRSSVPKDYSKSNIVCDCEAKVVYVLIATSRDFPAQHAFSLQLLQAPQPFDIRLANAYVRIFQEDCYSAPDEHRHSEVWETLTSSRPPRVIARLSSFTTIRFLGWLTVMEGAAHLKYEGQSFQSIAIMSMQSEWVAERAKAGYISLNSPISFKRALLNEKWIRAITNSNDIALHGVGLNGSIRGILDLSTMPSSNAKQSHKRNEVYTPELRFILPSKIKNITRFVIDGTMAFICAPNGDLYVILPSGVSFVKTQGRWHYLNFGSFKTLLSENISDSIAPHILALLLDLSFERKGALICIPDETKLIKDIVPDHGLHNVPNYELRHSIAGMKIDNPNIKHIVRAAAGVDGAMIINNDGTVIDVACMIGEPSLAALRAAGLCSLERFPGARSTAAWNASMFGVSIKVSEDGPITVFSKGRLLGQLG